MASVLLINPSYMRTYGSNHAGIANPVYPILGLACLAGAARAAGHKVEILDLSYRAYDPEMLRTHIRQLRPDVVGVTATTPLVNQMRDISFLVKDISPAILVVGGGAHASSLPRATLLESVLDAVVVGEGDYTFVDILDGKPLKGISGIFWRDGENVVGNPVRLMAEHLDTLPMPAWDLYPIDVYANSMTKILTRRTPLTTIEFSRGCVFKCDFCGSKQTMGLGYRKKSPPRCADELAHLHSLGYREVILTDDIFTSDNNWAIQVCEEIIRRGIDMTWTCTNGIRVDSANDELFQAMRRAGCYRVHFGFETGNDAVLKAFGKGGKATLEQGLKAVEKARKANLDTWGMFMVGLSADTESSMQDTINYAKRVKVDIKKFGVTIPFPGTPMFQDLLAKGKIKTLDWDNYNVYNESSVVFEHPTLPWATIQKYYRKAYMQAYYLNPPYIARRIWRSIKTREFFSDVYFGVKFLAMLLKTAKAPVVERYAFEDRWRPLNISAEQIDHHPYQKVMKRRTVVREGNDLPSEIQR